MNFLFDHDVPDELDFLLEHLGHRVERLREVLPRSVSDAEVMEYAIDHGLIVITCNRDDFLRLARDRPHRGIVIVIPVEDHGLPNELRFCASSNERDRKVSAVTSISRDTAVIAGR